MSKPIRKFFTVFVPALFVLTLIVALPACNNSDKSGAVRASGTKTQSEEPSAVHASGAVTNKHLSGATTK